MSDAQRWHIDADSIDEAVNAANIRQQPAWAYSQSTIGRSVVLTLVTASQQRPKALCLSFAFWCSQVQRNAKFFGAVDKPRITIFGERYY
jgi:hypothetical protein